MGFYTLLTLYWWKIFARTQAVTLWLPGGSTRVENIFRVTEIHDFGNKYRPKQHFMRKCYRVGKTQLLALVHSGKKTKCQKWLKIVIFGVLSLKKIILLCIKLSKMGFYTLLTLYWWQIFAKTREVTLYVITRGSTRFKNIFRVMKIHDFISPQIPPKTTFFMQKCCRVGKTRLLTLKKIFWKFSPRGVHSGDPQKIA